MTLSYTEQSRKEVLQTLNRFSGWGTTVKPIANNEREYPTLYEAKKFFNDRSRLVSELLAAYAPAVVSDEDRRLIGVDGFVSTTGTFAEPEVVPIVPLDVVVKAARTKDLDEWAKYHPPVEKGFGSFVYQQEYLADFTGATMYKMTGTETKPLALSREVKRYGSDELPAFLR